LKYGIQVTEVSIKEPSASTRTSSKRSERKQIAQQVAEQKRYEVDQAKRESGIKSRP